MTGARVVDFHVAVAQVDHAASADLLLCVREPWVTRVFLNRLRLTAWVLHMGIRSRGVHYMFAPLPAHLDFYTTFSRFVKFVERLAVLSLDAHRDHPLVMHAIWTFFDLVRVVWDLPFL